MNERITNRFTVNLNKTIKHGRKYSTITDRDLKLRPWYITGFTDAEGCFNLIISKTSSASIGFRVQIRYVLELHVKDIALLEIINNYFGGIGKITIPNKRESARLTIVSLNHIVNIMIPHFEKYPLQSAKRIDFELWKRCVNLMKQGKHLTQEGLEQIVSIKAAINYGLSDQLIKAFPQVTKLVRPLYISSNELLHPDWVTGFIEGDGSFFISLRSVANRAGVGVVANIIINLNYRDEPVLLKIKNFFQDIGGIYWRDANRVVGWKATKLNDILSVISHFDTYPCVGKKHLNFLIWKEVVTLMKKKEHLTPEGIIKIKILVGKLNK